MRIKKDLKKEMLDFLVNGSEYKPFSSFYKNKEKLDSLKLDTNLAKIKISNSDVFTPYQKERNMKGELLVKN